MGLAFRPDTRARSASPALAGRVIRLSPIVRYGIAVGAALATALLRLSLNPLWGIRFTFTMLVPAIMLSGWLGGFGPGTVTTLLCGTAAAYFWIEPADSWAVTDKSELLGLLLFMIVGAVISALNEAWRRGAAALSESEERLNVTVTSIGDAIVATDDHGRVTRLNPVAERLTGWSAAEAIGRPLRDVFVIINEQSRQPAPNPVDRVLRDGVVTGLANHTLLVSKEGRETPIDDSAAPIRTDDGRLVGVVMVFRDITDRRRLEREQTTLLEREQAAREETESARSATERASEQLRAALEAGHMGTWEYTMRTGVVKWSPGLEVIHGYQPGAFPGTFDAFRDEIHPADRAHVLTAIRQAVEERRDHHIEYRIVRRDGGVRWVEGRGQLFLDPAQQPDRMVGVCADITERKQAEERFRSAVEAAPAAMIMVDRRGTIVLTNALTERLLGYTAGEIVGQPIERLVPLRFREHHPALRTAFAGAPAQRLMGAGRDLYALRKDGAEVPVEIGLSPVSTHEGAFVLAAVTDITERIRAKELLRARTEELERVLEVIPAAVWIANDPECREVVGNQTAAAMFGLPRDRNVSQTPPPGHEPIVIRHFRDGRELSSDELPMQRAAATGRPQPSEELDVELPDGRWLTMLGAATPLLDNTGGVRGVVSAFSDITLRKEVEQQRAQLLLREQAARSEVERASRLKDEFLAVLSHELRTPLNAVLGYARLLTSGAVPPERANRALESIQRNAQAQARLVESLLDLSRIMAGKLELDLHLVEVSTIVEAALDVVRPNAAANGVFLDVIAPPHPVSVLGDAGRLQQVLWNLLSNAIKFTPREGRVAIRWLEHNGQVHVEVSDSGQGISADFLPQVFERFRQGDGEHRRSRTGLGLGLALVREMVHAHGGTVRAESPGEGRGSTFSFTLPLSTGMTADEPQTAQPPAEDIVESLSRLDILIVDDEDDVRDLLGLLLESRGAAPRAVSSVAEALEAIRQRRPDVLLADVQMPDEDGYSLIRKLRAREREQAAPRLPAIAVTAFASASDRDQAIAAGYDAHVVKPIDPTALARAILRVARVENT